MLEPFAARIAALSYEALDEDILDAARLRLFDTLIANAIGLTIEDGRRLAALAANAGPGDRLAETVRLNVGATRATEVDDINIAACATVGSVVIPVAVGLGAARGLDDQAVLAAIVAGYEAMISLGTAVDGASLLYKGVWPTYATAPFAAAAVGASLLGLDARGTANALSLALARTSTLTGRGAAEQAPAWCRAVKGAAGERAGPRQGEREGVRRPARIQPEKAGADGRRRRSGRRPRPADGIRLSDWRRAEPVSAPRI